MASIRRNRSPNSVSPALQEASPTSSGGSGTPRQTSIRISRRSTGGGGNTSQRSTTSRTSTNGTGIRSQRSNRTRRPTPIVRRGARRDANNQDDTEMSAATEEEDQNNGRKRRIVTLSRNGGQDNRRVKITTNTTGGNDGLRWYERLMPDFFLNMTAPITGYESRLDSDVEDDEYEILERQRLKRNKRVRRRLFGLLLLATAASVFLYSRGKIFRKAGMKAAVSTMKHRLEGGLAKSIQETMGK